MKLNPFNSPAYLIPAFALMSLPLAHAQISFDDGAAADSNWTSADNWDTNSVPTTGDTITIGSGFTVDYDVTAAFGNLPNSSTLIVDGTVSVDSVFRANGGNITVSSTGELTGSNSGKFYDWANATVTFQDGAQFTQGVWENKGTNTFNFELGTTDFNTLTPTSFIVSGGNSNISNATYNVDLNNYSGGTQTLSLVDYANTSTMTDAVFQTAAGLNAVNTGSTYSASLAWNDSTSAIEASIEAIAHTWDGGASDGQWKSANNWDLNELPTAGDSVTINNATVNHDAVGGDTLASNLTINLVDSDLDADRSDTEFKIIRLNNTTLNVDSTSALTGGFWDLNNATLYFEDGAQFTGTDWEQKGANVFDFELSSTGFTALTPGVLKQNTATSTTYRADLTNYTAGSNVITLVDFGGDTTSLTNAIFTGGSQYSLNVNNSGSDTGVLYWDEVDKAVRLNVNQTKVWQGDVDSVWSTTGNWLGAPDQSAPVSGDTLLINNGDTVDFTDNGNLAGNLTINLEGSTLNKSGEGAIRLNNATINVDAASTLSGGFWDLQNADIVFEDGAQATMESWEQKDINSFTYQLGAYDFTTLTPDRFLIGTGSLTGDIANATYIADFSNFANWSLSNLGSNSITLMDFATDFASMDNAKFQGASFDYINMGANIENAAFAWDNSLEAITLTFDINAVPEPSSTTLLGLGGLALMLRRKRS
jgi:hypothetical protein